MINRRVERLDQFNVTKIFGLTLRPDASSVFPLHLQSKADFSLHTAFAVAGVCMTMINDKNILSDAKWTTLVC